VRLPHTYEHFGSKTTEKLCHARRQLQRVVCGRRAAILVSGVMRTGECRELPDSERELRTLVRRYVGIARIGAAVRTALSFALIAHNGLLGRD
jgi:hypothetical protein